MNSNQDHPTLPEIGAADFESEVLQAKQPVLVAFWAPWSRPCQVLLTVLEDVALACAGRLKVVRLNADDHPDLSLWYEVQSIPTLLVFRDGCPHARLVGTASKEAILSKLESAGPGRDAPPSPHPHLP